MNRLALALALLLPALLPPAAATDGRTAEPVQEHVEVGLINIPVYVEDHRGQPVTDLSREDFQVFEDGTPMELSSFAWVQGEAVEAVSEMPPLHVVLYIDSLNIRPTVRQQVLKVIGPWVEKEIAADVPLMLAAANPDVEVLKAFSAPRSVLSYRLEELGQSAGGGLFDANAARLQRDEILRNVRRVQECVRNPGCDLRSMETQVTAAVGEIRAYSNGVSDQSEATLERFREFARSLSSFPGTKSVLYVSDGFPMQAGRDLLDDLANAVRDVINKTDPAGERERSGGDASIYDRLLGAVERAPMDFLSNDISRLLEETAAAANANGIRVYTLQASGLTDSPSGGADDQAALRLLANATGGAYQPGGTRAGLVLERMLGDSRSYYSLAYRPPPAPAQSYHQIEVKLKKRRMRPRYPHGYVTKSDESLRVEQVLAALFHGYGENSAEVALDLGPAGRDDQGQPVLPVVVRIPVRALDLETRGGEAAADLKLIVAVMNAAGRTTMLREFPIAVRIPAEHLEQAREQDYPVRLTVAASQGRNRVAVGLWDESAERPALTHGVYEWTE